MIPMSKHTMDNFDIIDFTQDTPEGQSLYPAAFGVLAALITLTDIDIRLAKNKEEVDRFMRRLSNALNDIDGKVFNHRTKNQA